MDSPLLSLVSGKSVNLHGGQCDIVVDPQVLDGSEVRQTVFVLKQVGLVDGYTQLIGHAQDLQLKGLPSSKGKIAVLSFFLAPDISYEAVSDNRLLSLVLKARV